MPPISETNPLQWQHDYQAEYARTTRQRATFSPLLPGGWTTLVTTHESLGENSCRVRKAKILAMTAELRTRPNHTGIRPSVSLTMKAELDLIRGVIDRVLWTAGATEQNRALLAEAIQDELLTARASAKIYEMIFQQRFAAEPPVAATDNQGVSQT